MRRIVFLMFVLLLPVLSGQVWGQQDDDTYGVSPAETTDITVNILGLTPSDGIVGSSESATVRWSIVGNGMSGTYRVEVGGDGSPNSGTLVTSTDAAGDWTGTKISTTTISANRDLDNGSNTIYVIAISGSDYAFASTAITLAVPPAPPTNVSLGIADEAINLYWKKSKSKDVSRYLIYYGNNPGTDATDYTGVDAGNGASPIEIGDKDHFTVKGLTNDYMYYFRIAALSDTDLESTLSEEVSGTPVKAEGATELSGEKGGCFIATAAYGSYDADSVRVLRRFRDQRMAENAVGRWMIQTYYRLSPPLARRIADSPMAKRVTMACLDPIVWMADEDLNHPTGFRFGFVGIVLGLAAIAMAIVKRERSRG